MLNMMERGVKTSVRMVLVYNVGPGRAGTRGYVGGVQEFLLGLFLVVS